MNTYLNPAQVEKNINTTTPVQIKGIVELFRKSTLKYVW